MKISSEDGVVNDIQKSVSKKSHYDQKSLFPSSYLEYEDEDEDEDVYLRTLIGTRIEKLFIGHCQKLIDKYKLEAGVLYPSRNYVTLTNLLDNQIELCNIIKNYRVKGILIDGEPGLGKSFFVNYHTANSRHCKSIYGVDLSFFTDQSIETIISNFMLNITSPTIFMLDELDKYVKFYIDGAYHYDSIKDEKVAIELKTKKQFTIETKTAILLNILKIIEKSGDKYPCYVLFCSNNFKTIFKGVSAKHFESLTTRFIIHNFCRCDHTEFIMIYVIILNFIVKI